MIELSELLKFDLFIFDSDGCLVEGGKPLPGAIDLTNFLKSKNKQMLVFTNNSTSHPEDVINKYQEIGFSIDRVINSGLLAGKYCRNEKINSVFLVGEEGLRKTMEDYNIDVRLSGKVDAVVVGMDRTLTYQKLAIATRQIRSGSRFIATNPDPSFPTPLGLEPGAGSMIAALSAATDSSPEIILGKPNPWGFISILDEYNITSNKAVMFGDRFETDIIGARNAGVPGVLVGTGISASRNKEQERAKLISEAYASDLEEIFKKIQDAG